MATAAEIDQQAPALERFRRDLDRLVAADVTIGVAVSGGPDSVALLLLAAEARPLQVEAASVDHVLRPEGRAEAEMVAALCERLGVPHRILTAEWDPKPETAVQEQARLERYRLLARWAEDRGLRAIATGHHLDDQAETFVMRLARGSGVKGLAGMRAISRTPGASLSVVRPLLGWRRSELEAVCGEAGIKPARDPSNEDDAFERVRIRKALAKAGWLDSKAIAASAANLAQADGALHWATTLEWKRAVTADGGTLVYRLTDAPREIRRRIIRRAILKLASEGGGAELRGRELDQVLLALRTGRKATLRGVLCTGGPRQWHFAKAPPRRG